MSNGKGYVPLANAGPASASAPASGPAADPAAGPASGPVAGPVAPAPAASPAAPVASNAPLLNRASAAVKSAAGAAWSATKAVGSAAKGATKDVLTLGKGLGTMLSYPVVKPLDVALHGTENSTRRAQYNQKKQAETTTKIAEKAAKRAHKAGIKETTEDLANVAGHAEFLSGLIKDGSLTGENLKRAQGELADIKNFANSAKNGQNNFPAPAYNPGAGQNNANVSAGEGGGGNKESIISGKQIALGTLLLVLMCAFIPGAQVAIPFIIATGLGLGVGKIASDVYDKYQSRKVAPAPMQALSDGRVAPETGVYQMKSPNFNPMMPNGVENLNRFNRGGRGPSNSQSNSSNSNPSTQRTTTEPSGNGGGNTTFISSFNPDNVLISHIEGVEKTGGSVQYKSVQTSIPQDFLRSKGYSATKDDSTGTISLYKKVGANLQQVSAADLLNEFYSKGSQNKSNLPPAQRTTPSDGSVSKSPNIAQQTYHISAKENQNGREFLILSEQSGGKDIEALEIPMDYIAHHLHYKVEPNGPSFQILDSNNNHVSADDLAAKWNGEPVNQNKGKSTTKPGPGGSGGAGADGDKRVLQEEQENMKLAYECEKLQKDIEDLEKKEKQKGKEIQENHNEVNDKLDTSKSRNDEPKVGDGVETDILNFQHDSDDIDDLDDLDIGDGLMPFSIDREEEYDDSNLGERTEALLARIENNGRSVADYTYMGQDSSLQSGRPLFTIQEDEDEEYNPHNVANAASATSSRGVSGRTEEWGAEYLEKARHGLTATTPNASAVYQVNPRANEFDAMNYGNYQVSADRRPSEVEAEQKPLQQQKAIATGTTTKESDLDDKQISALDEAAAEKADKNSMFK